jgi:hypothetical protein
MENFGFWVLDFGVALGLRIAAFGFGSGIFDGEWLKARAQSSDGGDGHGNDLVACIMDRGDRSGFNIFDSASNSSQ